MSSTDNTLGDMGSRVTLADISPPSTPPGTNGRKTRARNEPEEQPCSPKILPALPSPPASPLPNGSKSTTEDNTPTADENQLSVSVLRARLGIDSWRCGAYATSRGRPCRNLIPDRRKADINTQIESVRNCSHLSPKLLRDELDKLAKLVHCYQHIIPIKRCSRVDSWRNKFNLEESVEEQIEKTLKYYPTTCVGMDKDRTPCIKGIGGWCVKCRAETIGVILNPETYLNDEMLEYYLHVLKVNMFCDKHINDQGPEQVAAWKREIQKIRKEKNRVNSPEDEDSTAQPTSLLSDRDPAAHWTHEFDTTPFDIIVNNTSDCFKSSFPEIRKTLEKPLKPNDPEKGHVYAYEVEGNAGFVKIGFTSQTTEDRHKGWSFDCNRKPIALYPIPPTQVTVPNARRVEKLCHAELTHRNIKIYCHGCLKTHIEWFKVSPEEAIAVIKKWSRWMLTSPYEPQPNEKSWRLKKKESEKAKDIDRFMKRLSADQPSEK